jgi:HEAT repeat protein
MLDSEYLPDRLAAIEALGKISDEKALQKLRKMQAPVSQELQYLVIAVGKLKKSLGDR